MTTEQTSPAAEASDPTGALTVWVDARGRLVRLDVLRPDDVRIVEDLRAAVSAAHRAAAVRAALRDQEPARSPHRRPVAVATPARPVHRRELLDRHQIRGEVHATRRAGAVRRSARGTSANGCVSVELLPAQPYAVLDADQGWLGQANATQIAHAVSEAFALAYQERTT